MRSRIVFGWETLETILAEPNIREMLVAWWEELSPIPDLPIDPDWARLFNLERRGIYRVWVARVDGTLAGFVSFTVEAHFLHRTTLWAIDQGHYLSPAFRDTSAMVGARMWRSAKAALIAEGVQVAMLHDNSRRPLSPFFLGIGARPFAAMWLWDLRRDEEGA